MSDASLRIVSVLVLSAGLAASGFAQSPANGKPGPVEDLHGLKVREDHPAPTPTPFPLGVDTGRTQTLEFRSLEQMTGADKRLVQANEDEIARRAGLQGFRLDVDGRAGAGKDAAAWGYEQAVCPVFPNHVVLEYSRSNGAGDVTLFSAVIPRGDGHVRVIPVQRRGYSLWTLASSNALTLNDFNHMVKEEPNGLSPDWLTLGLCYAALTGGHVRAGLVAGSAAEEHYPLAIPASLEVSRKGGAEVHFADTRLATGPKSPREWTLIFAQNGRLLKVKHTVATELVEKPVPGNAVEVKGVPVKEGAVEISKPGN
jgi:hypothetical protein